MLGGLFGTVFVIDNIEIKNLLVSGNVNVVNLDGNNQVTGAGIIGYCYSNGGFATLDNLNSVANVTVTVNVTFSSNSYPSLGPRHTSI